MCGEKTSPHNGRRREIFERGATHGAPARAIINSNVSTLLYVLNKELNCVDAQDDRASVAHLLSWTDLEKAK